MKTKKLIVPIVVIVVLIVTLYYVSVAFLYTPWQYSKSELVWYKWHELKQPIGVEICHDSFEGECVYSTDEEDVKFILDALMNAEYITKSRGEFQELEYYDYEIPEEFNYWFDNQYKVIIRELEKTEDGFELGYHYLEFDIYPFTKYVKGFHGTYYYFTLEEDTRDFIYHADDHLEKRNVE